ncbi:MAG: tetratricopeptide repeat protein [Spirochaetales bacterium]|nr:tetratricopeptide repeat protein [Spirochaetales bacterium]
MKEYEDLFNKAFQAGKKRNYKRSLKLFQQLVTLTDEFPSSFLYMGRCCHAMGETEQAVLFFKYYLKRFPGSTTGLFFLGRTYLALGAWNKGLSTLNRVYKKKPDFPQVKAFLGFGFLKYKKIEPAVTFLGKAVEETPDNDKLYQAYLNALYLQGLKAFYREDMELAGQILTFLATKGAETILLYLHMAIIEKERGNFRDSLSWYDKALEEQPDDILIIIQRAELLYLAGDKEEAMAIWEKFAVFNGMARETVNPLNLCRLSAIEHYQKGKYRKAFYFATQVLKHEKDPNMHLVAAESARNMGNFEIAVNHYNRVIDIDHNMIEPRYGLIMAFWQQSEWSEVLVQLNKMKRLAPDDEIGRYYRTLCYCKIGENPDENLEMVINEIHLSGPDPWLLTALGTEYCNTGNSDMAEKWFQKALLIKADHRDAFNGLIALQRLQDSPKALLKTYSDYLAIWNDDIRIRREYADILFQSQNYKTAAVQLEKLLPFYTAERGINRELAFCYRQCKRFRDAAIIYRQLLKSEPENQLFLRSLIYCLDKGGDRKEGIKILEKAAAFLPPETGMYLILGVLLYREEQYDEALSIFKKAHETAKNDWRPLYNIGAIYRDKGLKDYAQTYFSRSDRLKNGKSGING